MPMHSQLASMYAWKVEDHVQENRDLYREKFGAVLAILAPVMDVKSPMAASTCGQKCRWIDGHRHFITPTSHKLSRSL